MTEDEKIKKAADGNAARYWEYNTNPFPSTDTRKIVYDDHYKSAGGKN